MERYTIADVRRRRDPADYIQSIVLLGRNAGTATTDVAQILMAYEHMEGQLRRDLSRPTEHTTIESLIEEVNTLKHVWFDIYGSNNNNNRVGTQPRSNNDFTGRWNQASMRL